MRRLQRLSREPSRVFGANDERNYKWPLVKVENLDGATWYGPGFTSSLFRGPEGCPVLRRALERLGHTTLAPVAAEHLAPWFTAEAQPIELGEPQMVALSEKNVGAFFPVSDYLIPAIPVLYAERRYGPGAWEEMTPSGAGRAEARTAPPGGIRYRVLETENTQSKLVALVARVRRPGESEA